MLALLVMVATGCLLGMAGVEPGVILNSISGKVGNVVFGTWKGRPYIRKHVIPSNPETEGRRAQKNYIKKVVAWWHDIPTELKEWCKLMGANFAISGANIFVRDNVRAFSAEVPYDPPMAPGTSPQAGPVAGAISTASNETKSITFADFVEGPTGYELYAVLYERADTPPGESALSIKYELTGYNGLNGTCEMPEAATEYNIWVMFTNASRSAYSVATMYTVTSHS